MEPVLFYYTLLLLVSVLQLATSRIDGYSGKSPQYHIQTDEGEERYFKYQTDSGQYRKEKRLQDGTVIGTYGWVDPNGFLRLRDYIADDAGYRILKARTLYVGQNADVANSVSAAKHLPPSGGELASPHSSPFTAAISPQTSPLSYNLQASPSPTPLSYNLQASPSPSPLSYNLQASPSPSPFTIYVPPVAAPETSTPASTYRLLANLGPQYFPSSTPSPLLYHVTASPTSHHFPSSTPSVEIHHNALPHSTPRPILVYTSKSPAVEILHNSLPQSTPRPIAVYASTPRPVEVNYVSSPAPADNSVSYVRSDPSHYVSSTTPTPSLSVIGYTASTPSPSVRPEPIAGKYANPSNNFITETEKNRAFYQSQNKGYYRKRYVQYAPRPKEYSQKNYLSYKPTDQEYDGISTVQNGFRYFLPKQYHEEQTSNDGQKRAGSYGYVDPFGIRRVVYYNTGPGRGFQHRKNNRYVGEWGTPYDPRPVS